MVKNNLVDIDIWCDKDLVESFIKRIFAYIFKIDGR